MAKEQSSIKERQRVNIKEPSRYKVTIYLWKNLTNEGK